MENLFQPFLPALAILAVMAIAVALLPLLKGLGGGKRSLPYSSRKYLFTKAERSFLGVLESALPNGYRVLGKIRLADLIQVEKGTPKSEWQTAFNKIQSKHVDYVICDSMTLMVLAAVELDDKSHQRKSRQARDAFLEGALEAAGIPLIRFRVKASYTASDVRDTISQTLGISAIRKEPEMPAEPAPPPKPEPHPDEKYWPPEYRTGSN